MNIIPLSKYKTTANPRGIYQGVRLDQPHLQPKEAWEITKQYVKSCVADTPPKQPTHTQQGTNSN